MQDSLLKFFPTRSELSHLSEKRTMLEIVMLGAGVYAFGRFFVTGILGSGVGAVKGLFITAGPNESDKPKSIIDICFDGIEETSVFLLRKSMAMMREGFKGGLSGIIHEGKAVMWPLFHIYASITEVYANKALNKEKNTDAETVFPVASAPLVDAVVVKDERISHRI